jgi:hypothetical protein
MIFDQSKGSSVWRDGARAPVCVLAVAALVMIQAAWGQVTGPVSVGSIHGSVVGQAGLVYEGARVVLSIGAGGPPARETLTDASGRFGFESVPAGEFRLTVSSKGFEMEAVAGSLKEGESYEAEPIELKPSGPLSEVRVNATRTEIAQEQLRDEEKQRVLGIVPNFTVAYVEGAQPLNARQKFELVWKMSVDPFTLATTALSAGMDQANGNLEGYGQGAAGYAKRFGADYGGDAIGTVLGSAILPSVFRQDPRYFYKGKGSWESRVGYALANSVMCKGDNGHWQPNYSRIIAGPAAGGIANLYLPANDRKNAASIFEDSAVSKAMGGLQNIFQEFVVKRLTPKAPK